MARKTELFDIPPYPGYRVSADGERIRYKKHPVSIERHANGVPFVEVKALGGPALLPLSVLVAFTFLGNPPGRHGFRVGHKNGDYTDVSAENLFWDIDPDYWQRYYRGLMRAPYHRPPKLPPELLK